MKKLLSLTLSIILLIGLFTACEDDSGGSQTRRHRKPNSQTEAAVDDDTVWILREIRQTTYSYDNRVVEFVYSIQYDGEYTPVGAVSSYDGVEDSRSEYEFDTNGNFVNNLTDPNSNIKTGKRYGYDSEGRLIEYTQYLYPDEAYETTTYSYDSGGRLVKQLYNGGAEGSWEFSFDYDKGGSLIQCTGYMYGYKTSTYTYFYDGNGKLTKQHLQHTDHEDSTFYKYDSNGYLVEKTRDSEKIVLEYDACGNLVGYTEYFDGEIYTTYVLEYDEVTAAPEQHKKIESLKTALLETKYFPWQ